ncbi:hypothetical protein ONZ43_g5168 [Nemania bipapillata]|uniref:Uncharacterized protein n=1 Tax=Nemania bipapillata TaxID=110536 RepID=A0ACC2IDV1_9PEZI|nr:hypothetical protein ONZ43_g5168 [Nemania bipapillata]
MRSVQAIVALGAIVRQAQAVFVAPNSPCGQNCGNVFTTTPDQIVCDDPDYGTTSGKVFHSYLQAMLFNMRYTTAQCLFHLQNGQCSIDRACGRLQSALEYGNLSATVTPYGYCSIWSDYDLDKCTDCLLADSKTYMRNFISILSGACQLQLQPPQTIPLTGDPFTSALVNVTSPSNTATVNPHNNVGPLTTGALAGIVIGGVAFLLILLGCGVVINGKRRRKNYLRRREEQVKNWPSPAAGGEMFETPLSQKPLRGGWGDSPVSAATHDGAYPYPRYFSPYATQFDSPVSAVEGPAQMTWPTEKAQSIGVALSPDHENAESPWSDRKGKERANNDAEGYELQEGVNSAGGYGYPDPMRPPMLSEAPVLNHPGYGRQGQAGPPR